ncbi:hypothetical protein UCRPC4_g03323 [Phaeomoniella chlamydospora]|uniref:Methyltransferase domain-containing protein n=1 Tax=Phaeomoniella chlamydospora TaxID=158046 RepID=A0A0G2EIS1_PHACM|nr:hypothetical protein UCRPC4_g03323 [Phaeomoniella chlamydospora]
MSPEEARQQRRDRNTHVTAAEARDIYDVRFAALYDDLYFYKDTEAATLVSKAGLQPGMFVLDLGTGTGAVARAADRAVGPLGFVAAVDISMPMLQVAFAKGGWANVGFGYLDAHGLQNEIGEVATVENFVNIMPSDRRHRFVDFRGFDRILALGLYNDIEVAQRPAVLRRWASLLAPGGVLVYESFPLTRDLATVVFRDLTRQHEYAWPGTAKTRIWLAAAESFDRAFQDGEQAATAAGLTAVNKGRMCKKEKFFDAFSTEILPTAERRWQRSVRHHDGTMPHQFLENEKRRCYEREKGIAVSKGWQMTHQTAAVVLEVKLT